MSRQFEVSIIVDCTEETTEDNVSMAVKYLLRSVARYNPDVRIDFMGADITVDVFIPDGQAA